MKKIGFVHIVGALGWGIAILMTVVVLFLLSSFKTMNLREYTISCTKEDGTVVVKRIYADSLTFTSEAMTFFSEGCVAETKMAGKEINVR